MISGNVSKKGTEPIINKTNSKSKVIPSNLINKPNSSINPNNNAKRKEEDCLIFKDKSPIMFNRSKNNFYSKESVKSNYGKFSSSNTNNNNFNIKENQKIEISNPIEKLNPNNLILNKNLNVKSLLSNNSLKSPSNVNFDKNINNDNEKLLKKISQQNVFISGEKINNYMANQENHINEALKRELDLLKTELSIANLVFF